MARRQLSVLQRVWNSQRARRIVLVSFLAVVAFGLAVLTALWTRACAGNSCPSIAELGGYDPNQASKVYAADGRLITDLGLERRTVIPLGEMSPYVKAAFITTEDKRFYEHHGIDWYRVFGAIKNNIFKFRVAEGFSTITMQLARNLWPEDISGRDKTLSRKLREAHVAREIEAKYSKDKILELYLNQIDLGNRAYGVEAASQRYFGKSVRDLNVAEAATLAAIPKAPSRYNPRRNPNLTVQRRNTILNLLRDNGLLSTDDTERWKAYPLLLSSHSDFSSVAQYFVEYVRQQLDARFGADLYKSGYRVYTTLDLDTQQAAERALEARLEAIESGADGKFTWPTYRQYLDSRADTPDDGSRSTTPYLQGLVVTLDAKTGNIRAMVGGRDFEDSKFNRATQALRQPGSTFKPIVYATALGPPELRSRVRRPDDLAPGALHVTQHHRDQAGHGDRRGCRHQRGHQVRDHHAHPAVSLDPHRLGRRLSARDDRRVHHLRQPGHPHAAERDPPGRGPEREDRMAAAGALGLGDGYRPCVAHDRRATRRGAPRHRGGFGRLAH
jgi:penicillin-binding protein 1A